MVISNCEITKQDSTILRSCVMDKNSIEYKQTKQFHTGVDLTGDKIYAAYGGTVVFIGEDEHGRCVIIQTGSSFCASYSNLDAIDVRAGQVISEGSFVGTCKKYVHVELLQQTSSLWPVRVGVATWYKQDPKPLLAHTLSTANVANVSNMNVTVLSGQIIDAKPSDELTPEFEFMLSDNADPEEF